MNVKTILAALLAVVALSATAVTYEEFMAMSPCEVEKFSSKLSRKDTIRLLKLLHAGYKSSTSLNDSSKNVIKAEKELVEHQKKTINRLKMSLANREEAVKLRDEMSKIDAKLIIDLMVKCNDLAVASGKPKLYDIEKMKRELGIVSSATNSPSISPVK